MSDSIPRLKVYNEEDYRSHGFAAPDIYFEPGYGSADSAPDTEWISLVGYKGKWQMPLHIRRSEGLVDAVSPYGYSGVYADQYLTEGERAGAWSDALHLLRKHRVLSVFLRQSPLFASPFENTPGEVVVDGHSTVCVKTKSTEATWEGMQGRSRTSIRKAEKLGYTTTIRPVEKQDLLPGSKFRELYEGAMRRREANARYFFATDYYRKLHAALGSNLLLAETIDAEGRCAAAALFMRHDGQLHYHLSGAKPEAGRNGATNQLIWSALQWACENSVDRVHLGGGVEGEDSLFKFKRSFGGAILQFYAYGVVVDAFGYAEAVRRRARQVGLDGSILEDSRFFPKYRITA